jgi:hypothetical protein
MKLVLPTCLLLLLLAPRLDEKQEALEKIQGYMDASDWKRAAKALKAVLRKHVLTEEEEAKVRADLARAEGLYEFQKIQKEYKRSHKVRHCAEKVADLLEKYGHVPEIRRQAGEYWHGLRSEYVLSLEEFEGWDDESEPRAIGIQLESRPEFVKRGLHAGRWTSPKGGGEITLPIRQEDWSEYAFLCLWVYTEKYDRKKPTHIEIQVRTEGNGYFVTHFAIEWTGWQEVRRLMITKKTQFSRMGPADWGKVTMVTLKHDDTFKYPFDIVLDDIRLEKAVR